MAEAVPEKSRGLKFAEQQLLRHGWEHGKGLGRAENGISEAIKVKVKCDKGGVGHKQGEQFTFHWWDHVFNKASASLQVESDQNGVKVNKTVEEDEEGMISNKKPTKATLAKAKLYGCFVKSATLLSGQEQPEPKLSSSDDSSSSDDDEDEQLDLSSTTKLSDADLMKACGGRTAHKGARHGLNMSAKLARLEQQEAEFMAKYGKKSQSASASPVCATPPAQSAASSPERQEETSQASQSKKMKRKKSAGDICESATELNGEAVSESSEIDCKPKKKKKKKKENSNEATEQKTELPTEVNIIPVDNGGADRCQSKRKHKKRKKTEENEEASQSSTSTAESKNLEATSELSSELQTDTDTKTKKKKKKKKSKHHSERAEAADSHDTESSQSEAVPDCVPKKKKKKDREITEEVEVVEEESAAKQKRKKCKVDKQTVDKEEVPPKKKKKKSKE